MHYCLDREGHIIQFKMKDEGKCRGIMNIKNCRVVKAKFKDNNDEYIFGLNIMGRKDNQDFYSYQESDIDMWYEHMKPICVLLNLNDAYERQNKIGKGNFATVYKYKRKSDGALFAVKSLEKKKIMESIRKRDTNPLLSEIEIMRASSHKQIIKMYEVYEADKHIHLVLELLEGGELFNRIRNRGTYTESDAIKVMQNVLEALCYLHEKGIVHRDLKPENLILAGNDDDYNVKIADFGLATFVKPNEKLSLPCGSPGYVAFELLQDNTPGYDTKADIFSVGVILYILLTGRPPFHGADCRQILAKNKQGDPPYPQRFWNRISEEGQDLVKKMLEKDQNIRVSAEEALTHPWFNENGDSHDLGDAIQEINKLQDQEPPTKSGPTDGPSYNLLTTTPVMAGRKLKDTCESPWNPSGMTPKMDPKTPMLKHGFEQAPRKKLDIPGIGIIGGGAQPNKDDDEDENKKIEANTLKKFDMMQAQRKMKTPQGTINFGAPVKTDAVKNVQKSIEENKVDPVTNKEVSPDMVKNEAPVSHDKESPIEARVEAPVTNVIQVNPQIQKIINSEKDDFQPDFSKKELDNTPETKPMPMEMKQRITDADVNIKEEDLRECPDLANDSALQKATFKSFKPGVVTDLRVIPITPGDEHMSMVDRNKPVKNVKNSLLKAI